ncbi:MAG: DUF3089 domain-containing protein [Ferruginibacter sp.]|nr:DUF3089 domain-containing protein [Ferruginibacter sp.]
MRLSVFNESCRIFAPWYRQGHLKSLDILMESATFFLIGPKPIFKKLLIFILKIIIMEDLLLLLHTARVPCMPAD